MRPKFAFIFCTLLFSPLLPAEGCERGVAGESFLRLNSLLEHSRVQLNKNYYDHVIRTARRSETKEEFIIAKANYGRCMDQVSIDLRETLQQPEKPPSEKVWSRIYKGKERDLKGTPLEGGSLTITEGRQPETREDFQALMEALAIRMMNACQGLNPGDRPLQRKIGRETADAARSELHEATYRYTELSCGSSNSANSFVEGVNDNSLESPGNSVN